MIFRMKLVLIFNFLELLDKEKILLKFLLIQILSIMLNN